MIINTFLFKIIVPELKYCKTCYEVFGILRTIDQCINRKYNISKDITVTFSVPILES